MLPLRKSLSVDTSSTGKSSAPIPTEHGTFPFVVLDGGEEAEGSLGREVFDAYVRRSGPEQLSARQALVRALAEEQDPWDAKLAPSEPVPAKRPPVAAIPAPPPRRIAAPPPPPPPAEAAVEPERRGGTKLRIATRAATAAPFPQAVPAPQAAPESWPSLPPITSPLLPIPGVGSTPPGALVMPLPPKPAAISLPAMQPLPASPFLAPPAHRQPQSEGGGFSLGKLALVLIGLGLVAFGAWRAGWLPLPGAVAKAEPAQAAESSAATVETAPVPPPPALPAGPTAAFAGWITEVKVNGVFQGQPVRALINGRLIGMGERASVTPDVRLVDADVARRVLVFEEAGGARLEARY